MTGDDLITLVTEAATDEAASCAIASTPRAVLLAAADLLYIEAEGRSSWTLRKAIVREARA